MRNTSIISFALRTVFAWLISLVATGNAYAEFPICTNSAAQWNPAIWGNVVCWKDRRNDPRWYIYGMNLGTGQEFAISSGDGLVPDICGDIVVWDDRLGHIYGKDLGSGEEFQVSTTSGYNPAVSGDIVVWGRGDIYGKNLSTGVEFPICTHPSFQCAAEIYGNIVVWKDFRNGDYGDIYGKNLSTGQEFPVCTSHAAANYRIGIYGNIVVWDDNRSGNRDIYGKDLSTGQEFPVCINSAEKGWAAVYDNIVVWEDSRNGNYDIYAKDLSTDEELPICTNTEDQRWPSIYGNTVVWADYRNGNWDIYGDKICKPLPPEEDIDNDGLLNGWEINGLDVNGDGTVDFDLRALGADPMHKDLFVEVDAMVGRAPTQAALNRVVAAFAAVPNSLVDNPDGTDGITLHIQLDETNIPLADWPNAFVDFDNVKNNRFGTVAQRADANWSNIRNAKGMVYRYCVFANTHSDTTSSGLAEMPGDDFMVTLGAWPTPGGTEDQQVGTFMHEFGHNLNLGHGGDDNINFKPNYHSIMNYHWQMPHSNHTGWELDYSSEVLPTLNELNLDESAGLGGTAGVTVPVGPLPVEVVNESGPVDWDRDGDTWDIAVQADLNYVRSVGPGGPSPGQVLTGHNDWPILWYRLSGHPNFQDGVHDETTIPEEITYEIYREVYEARIDINLDFEPDTLNLESQGKFVTVFVEFQEGSDVSKIDISSLMLNNSAPALSTPVEIGDYDSDGITDLMVKFDREQVIEVLDPGEQKVCLTGRLSDGIALVGIDIILVLSRMGGEEAIDAEEAAVFTLFEAAETINELEPEDFNNEDSASKLSNEIDIVLAMIDDGMYAEGRDKLQNDILKRTNGCFDTGEPDEDDWIMTWEGQCLVCPLILEAIELLEILI